METLTLDAAKGKDATHLALYDHLGNVLSEVPLEPANVEDGAEALNTVLVDSEVGAPPKPPFRIAHLELPEIMATLAAVMPIAKGRPATWETMKWALRPPTPPGLPAGVTPQIALDCVLWAISIRNQRKTEEASHRLQGAKIGLASHEIKARFRLTAKRVFGSKREKGNRAKMAKASRKGNRR